MRWKGLLRRLEALLRRGRAEGELEEELSAHLELQARKHVAQGMRAEEALRRARIEFGGLEQAREQCRDVDRWRWLDASERNLRQCFRSLKKSPGFALIFILILTVAIGSNLAVFSTIDAFLLRPLPVDRPEELVRISGLGKDGRLTGLPSQILDLLKDSRAFQGTCGADTRLMAVEIQGSMRQMGTAGYTGGCFHTLRLPVELGRPITPSDDRLNTQGIAVITNALWHSAFGGRPDVLGKTIRIEGEVYTIVGVTDKRFEGLLLGFPQAVMIPLRQQPFLGSDGRKATSYWVNVLARRAPGVSDSQALASVVTQKDRLLEQSIPHRYNEAQRKEYLSQKLTLTSAKTGFDYFLRDRFGEPLYTIFGICAALLLVACVNLTSLLLARSSSRQREVAVRLALGAKRTHIAGMFVLENAMLVAPSAILGVVVAFWTARMILAQGDQMFGNFSLHIGLDPRVVLFLMAAILFVMGIFAAAAIWQAGRLASPTVLKQSGRGMIASNGVLQKILVGVQISLTLAVVAASTSFGASLKNMYDIDFGINPRNVWEVLLAARPRGYRNFAPKAYYSDLLRQIESLPNVKSASLSNSIPFFTFSDQEPVARIENGPVGREVQARLLGIGNCYFQTLGAKIVAGEDFQRPGENSGEPAAILSLSLAQYLASRDAAGGHAREARDLLGHHVRVGTETEYQRLKVTGIASDVDLSLVNPGDNKPFTVYINFWQHRDLQRYPVLLIKSSSSTLAAAAIRRILDRNGREYVERSTSLATEIDNALVENRLVAYLSGTFSVLALIMAAIGLFGLLSYQVSNRTGEIGIRMALGAKRAQIQWLILRQIVALVAVGTLAGLALTFAVQKLIAGLLYGVSAYNPSLLLFCVFVLAATALIAGWIPIQRASTVDPLEALRHE